jgi:hypothetical protein
MDGDFGSQGSPDWGRGQNGSQNTQPDDSGAQSNSNFLAPSAGL